MTKAINNNYTLNRPIIPSFSEHIFLLHLWQLLAKLHILCVTRKLWLLKVKSNKCVMLVHVIVLDVFVKVHIKEVAIFMSTFWKH